MKTGTQRATARKEYRMRTAVALYHGLGSDYLAELLLPVCSVLSIVSIKECYRVSTLVTHPSRIATQIVHCIASQN